MIQMFVATGLSRWLRYVGFVEFVSGTLLLIPIFSGIAALVLLATSIGAILIRLFMIEGSPTLPLALLLIMSIVTWGRKETILRLVSRTVRAGSKAKIYEYGQVCR
jgi:hypothetical protein